MKTDHQLDHREQMIRFARNTAALIRVARASSEPKALRNAAEARIHTLWNISRALAIDDAYNADAITAWRSAEALNEMLIQQ